MVNRDAEEDTHGTTEEDCTPAGLVSDRSIELYNSLIGTLTDYKPEDQSQLIFLSPLFPPF